MGSISEPVPKDVQAKYVEAANALHWLADNSRLDEVHAYLTDLKKKALAELVMEGRSTPLKYEDCQEVSMSSRSGLFGTPIQIPSVVPVEMPSDEEMRENAEGPSEQFWENYRHRSQVFTEEDRQRAEDILPGGYTDVLTWVKNKLTETAKDELQEYFETGKKPE